ncbi:glycoside hydrolase family 13 protein [Microbacter margulisiae]|uniref:Glycosidase n=1 Tax=Microbacter margulisiae TaxID=1350067 RepID=A0A7W5DT74_9PORP|nr:glycoside hydrolase family 13 protein [Microbacter margulisiae]MBB3188637.1 glycosidase [Microbacter margulisiae]
MKKIITVVLLFISIGVFAQLEHVEPAFWWIGFKNPHLQLLVNGPQISKTDVSMHYPGVELTAVHKVTSPNYLFLDLVINSKIAKPGKFVIKFSKNGKTLDSYTYELKARTKGSSERQGFSSADVIYLLMPDRFANGTTKNDNVPSMIEKADRSSMNGRHGGDILGMEEHINYLKDLGVTAVWSTPLLENNNERTTYHGYAITNYYKIDPRFGTNQDYVQYVKDCHQNGIKVIMDMVANHCGINHWWMKDLPMPDWIHQFPSYTQSNFQMSTIQDPHASAIDKKIFLDGWFDRTMPDLNQNNPYLLTYLTQNAIWWIEYAGIDGIRMDTYPYCDKEPMAKWAKAIMTEYPHFNIMGETWLSNPVSVAYWQKGALNPDHFNSYLPTVMDFPLLQALEACFNEGNGWDTGMKRLYNSLAYDYLFPNTNNILVFAENHDTPRFNFIVKNNVDKFKLAMAFLMTTRGIPEIYYGSEIGMTGDKAKGDGDIRRDFPGGWPNDSINAFTAAGRTPLQNEYFNYLSKLLHWRQKEAVIQTGKLIHYIPQNNVYVYFRYNNKKTVMVILNGNNTEQTLNTARFSQCIKNFTRGTDVETGKTIQLQPSITIPKETAYILELK